MFEKLRRAKSFIHKSKHEEERQKYADLDLSDVSHLRRNVVIDSEVLKQQAKLNKIKENVSDEKKTTLRRKVSRSNEHLHDQVLEQLRKFNFGDSYSKKDAQKIRESSDNPSEFKRRHPGYISERKFHRRSFGVEDRAKNIQKIGRDDKHVIRRNSGDVMSNFAGNNHVRLEESKQNLQKIETNQQPVDHSENVVNKIHKNPVSAPKTRLGVDKSAKNVNTDDVLSNFDRENPAYWSERSIQLVRLKCSEQFVNSTPIVHDDDFLLNRKSVDLSYNFDRRHPAYVSDRNFRKDKPDILEKSGIKSMFQKVKKASNKHQESSDFSETSSFSSGSTSSSASASFDRNHPAYISEIKLSQNSMKVIAGEEQSRKRQHCVTSTNFDRNRPAYTPERTFLGESRKKVFDRIKRDGER